MERIKFKKTTLFGFFFKSNITTFIVIILIFLTTVGIFIYQAIGLHQDTLKREMPGVIAKDIVKGNYREIDTSRLEKYNGRIEVISGNKVIYAKGIGAEPNKEYGAEEFADLIRSYPFGNKSDIMSRALTDPSKHVATAAIIKNRGESPLVLLSILDFRNLDEGEIIEMFLSENNNQRDYKGIRLTKYLLLFFFNFIVVTLIYLVVKSFIVYKKLSKPIKELSTAIDSVRNNKFDIAINLKGPKELQEIQAVFNYMALELDKYKMETEELQNSKARLILDISHDLKTPITTINGYSEALYSGLVEDEEQRIRYLKYINDKSKRLNNLIDELFIYTKVNNSGYKLNLKQEDLSELVRNALLYHYGDFEDKEFELDIDIPDYHLKCSVDKLALTRALTNIIANAIKYNPKGTKISVKLEKVFSIYKISIEDNGVGISADIREHIFEEFVRGDNSRASDGGSGIGLAITKKIIELHSGRIIVESKLGKGTKFIIELNDK